MLVNIFVLRVVFKYTVQKNASIRTYGLSLKQNLSSV